MTPRMYYVSYGPQHQSTNNLNVAREIAKRVARDTMYEINIVSNGHVLETWKPRISKSGRVSFRHSRAA